VLVQTLPVGMKEIRMALDDQDAQIEKLKADHAGLEQEIDDELSRPYPDDQHIADLKRQKLRIKDELLKLENV
jgi:hypothetical protein